MNAEDDGSRGDADVGRLRRRPVVPRRALLGHAGAAAAGAAAGWWARGSRRPGEWLSLGPVEELLARTSLDGWTPAPDLGDGLVHAIVRWDPSRRRDDGLRADVVYASEPVVDARRGLMVLLLRSPHQGCAVEFCPTSGWFEDPCHGSRFNGWGEWTGGPSPRGLDRRPSRIAYGALEVRPTTWIEGTPRDRRILEQDPMGPSCVQL